MKRKILTMLRQGREYVSGQQICDSLGVSRTAVWKTIRALKAEGYVIEAVSNRGYRLLQSPDLLTEAEIGSRRCDCWESAPLVVYEETDSTNIQAARLAGEGAPEGTLVVADRQTGGKGRRGRRWEMSSGTGIAMSFALKPDFEPQDASMLTLLAALAGKRAVDEAAGVSCLIKWPNDLVLGGKKICGILTEMSLEENYIRQIVVGMGFNVHHEKFPEELADKATSLYRETGRHFSRAEIICLVMKYFGSYYRKFCREKSLAFIREEYDAALINRGQQVRVMAADSGWAGTCLGIDDSGALLVRGEDGGVCRVTAGEVSVRGLYHYT